MKKNKLLINGFSLIIIFIIWTILIQKIDVKPIGINGTNVGFSTLNHCFHKLTGENMLIYYITDWLGLIPIFSCMFFGIIGLIQLVKRKSLLNVDIDIIFLGIYYVVVIIIYLIFETIPINYRPIFIEGVMEVSYPSSTTLLVLAVMPTVNFQSNRRIKNVLVKKGINIFIILFLLFMVIGRTISGVHWLTDIIAAVIISIGLYLVYKSIVLMFDEKQLSEEF